ncbi:MAG TPA: sigma-70 family RNA polymerase sigma factor [Gaiellaceae bacterium]|nr:sigma-70 family RNA polymerase sigma factor [Gaiellaceae bacterium]
MSSFGSEGGSAAGTAEPVEHRLEEHRVELTAYCYRMLGSAADAEDAVQETLVRAWRALDRFEGRSSLRSWLYRIASNVCFDMLGSRQRRALPMDLSAPGTADGPLAPLPESTWIEPVPDARVVPAEADPAEQAVAKESLRLAFVAALQHLPPRQRAVLILREVLRWEASEVAELLATTVASVNSALQRARASLDAKEITPAGAGAGQLDEAQKDFLERYVAAFEAYDMDSLTTLLAEDAEQSMPPYSLWLRGREEILRFWFGPGIGCRGSKLVPVAANGQVAWAHYRPSESGEGWDPWALKVVELGEDGIAELTFFLATERVFPLFGLPPRL